MASGGNDAKFFTRGKIQEFKAELQEAAKGKDKKFAKRKTVLKKIVANITMGNDSMSLYCFKMKIQLIPRIAALAQCPKCFQRSSNACQYLSWKLRKVLLRRYCLCLLLRIRSVVYLFLVSYGRVRPDLIERAIPHFTAVCASLPAELFIKSDRRRSTGLRGPESTHPSVGHPNHVVYPAPFRPSSISGPSTTLTERF